MYTMDDIMNAALGEESNKIRVVFRKTVLVRQYETESVEVESSIELNDTITGLERMMVGAVLQAQAEYQAYIQLALKGVVTQTELVERKVELEKTINTLDAKSVELTGKSLDHIMNSEHLPRSQGNQ